MQTKTITSLLLIAIATIGTVGIGIGTATQLAQAAILDLDDLGHGQSFHDSKGDLHSNGHA